MAWPMIGRLLALMLMAAAPADGQPLQPRIERALAQSSPGTRFGLLVTDWDGHVLVAVNPDGRFIPASNTKVLVTAAAFALLPGIDRPDADGGALVRLEEDGAGPPDVVLEGNGDSQLSSSPDCVTDCLIALADAVAARTRRVDDVIGDDRRFADERWSQGMSWNNISSRYGTGISALTLDDNELHVRVTPGAAGEPPSLLHLGYYEIDNRAVTIAQGKTELEVERLPGSRRLLLSGKMVAGAAPEVIKLGIDDPAHYAAWRFGQLLEQRGVAVGGAILARHRSASEPAPSSSQALARLTPPPLATQMAAVNKPSQNLYSELLLRRLGAAHGRGRVADGIAAVETMLARAGVDQLQAEIHDGSGMSTYNRISPRGMVSLLEWIDGQPWADQWRSSLPVAGVDGTLAPRFRGTALQGRMVAKTGTLNASNGLAGYMIARSGATLRFAAYANDVPGGGSANKAIDEALVAIAAAY